MKPALQLEGYHFDKIRISANEGDFEGPPDHTVHTKIQCGASDEDPHRWRIILDIETGVKEEGGSIPPYDIGVQVVGYFSESLEDQTMEERQDLVVINGGSILFSAAREFLLSVTGRSSRGPYKLPTIRFAKVSKAPDEAAITGEPAQSKEEG